MFDYNKYLFRKKCINAKKVIFCTAPSVIGRAFYNLNIANYCAVSFKLIIVLINILYIFFYTFSFFRVYYLMRKYGDNYKNRFPKITFANINFQPETIKKGQKLVESHHVFNVEELRQKEQIFLIKGDVMSQAKVTNHKEYKVKLWVNISSTCLLSYYHYFPLYI